LSGEAARRMDPWRCAARMLGDLLIGVAIGLLGYYAVTNVVGVLDQRSLRAHLPASATRDAVVRSGPAKDFAGWAEQDRAYWEKLPEGGAFGRLVIARMKLDAVVVKGVSRADLQRGPGWISWTDLPGPSGNCGISGHRTTYLQPFRAIDTLREGDTIRFFSPYRRYIYRVKRTLVVLPSEVGVVASTATPMLTLTACEPPFSARYRIVVQSDLVEVSRLAAEK